MLTHHDLKELEVGKKFPASQWNALRQILARPTVGHGVASGGPEGTMSYQSPDTIMSAAGTLMLVKVSNDGGSAGGAGSTCSFTYSVTDLDDVEIESGVSPQVPRMVNMEYTAASGYGLATFVDDELILLCTFGETPSTTSCP